MGFIDEIKTKAKADLKTIVLPETEDVRTYEAAEAILKEGTAKLVLIGSEEEVAKIRGISISAEHRLWIPQRARRRRAISRSW